MFDQAERLRQLALGSDARRKIIKKNKIPRVITITSGKGGVGKTNLVVNLAIALSRLGKRVAVLDADLGLTNVDIILGLLPMHNLHDVVRGTKKMENIIITGPEGMKIIPGGSGLAEMANLTSAQRDRLLDSLLDLENEADILLIDTGAGLSRSVLSFIAAADELIVITTPEPTSITDAYGIIKVVSKLRAHENIKLVVNQVRDHQEGMVIAERFAEVSQKFLQVNIEFLGEICSDNQVVRAVKQQQPFMTLFPRTRATKDVENIAGKLLDITPGKPRGISGFLSRFTKMIEN